MVNSSRMNNFLPQIYSKDLVPTLELQTDYVQVQDKANLIFSWCFGPTQVTQQKPQQYTQSYVNYPKEYFRHYYSGMLFAVVVFF